MATYAENYEAIAKERELYMEECRLSAIEQATPSVPAITWKERMWIVSRKIGYTWVDGETLYATEEEANAAAAEMTEHTLVDAVDWY